MLLYEMFLLYMKKPYAVSTPCAPKEHTAPPFDVKAPTYIRSGCTDLRLSVLFEIILHQALKQTGETTRACRFCLQVLNFLQTEGWSAFYRKFLRISDIRELWAATRILSRGSMNFVHLCLISAFFLLTISDILNI